MAGVPFIFGNATTSIPLSNLDANFNTGVTIGNTTVGLGNTVTTLGNVTLTNTIASGALNGTLGATTPNTISATTIGGSSTIGVGAATPSASGAGITFPATQSASSDANTLDDYEEGTWTPGDGSGAGLTLNTISATYTKIGNTVRVSWYGTYPATASTNGAIITGLPFLPSNYGSASILSANSSTSALVRAVSGQTKIDIKQLVSDVTVTNTQLSSNFMIFTLVYVV